MEKRKKEKRKYYWNSFAQNNFLYLPCCPIISILSLPQPLLSTHTYYHHRRRRWTLTIVLYKLGLVMLCPFFRLPFCFCFAEKISNLSLGSEFSHKLDYLPSLLTELTLGVSITQWTIFVPYSSS